MGERSASDTSATVDGSVIKQMQDMRTQLNNAYTCCVSGNVMNTIQYNTYNIYENVKLCLKHIRLYQPSSHMM